MSYDINIQNFSELMQHKVLEASSGPFVDLFNPNKALKYKRGDLILRHENILFMTYFGNILHTSC